MKKTTILFLCTVMLLTSFAGWATPAQAEGETVTVPNATPISVLLADGARVTAGTVYSIANKEDMLTFAQVCNESNGWFAGATVIMTADVDMNPGWVASETAPATEWVPIKLFSGTFDGQGHKLSGIYAKGILGWGNNTSEEACGLFQTIGGKNVTVKDLKLTNSYLIAKKYIGSIVGCFSNATDNTGALISGVTSDAIVVSTENLAGGIVGGAFSQTNTASAVITIENCVFNGSASVKTDAVGGILAVSWRPVVIRNCINNGKLYCGNTGAARIGGIIGKVEGGALCELTGCVNMADLTLQKNAEDANKNESGSAVGGLIGWYSANGPVLKMTDCVNAGKMSSGRHCTGGMVGIYQKPSGEFTRCFYTGVFAGGANYYSGGFIGQFNLNTSGNTDVVTFTDCMYAYQSFVATDDRTYWLNGVGVYAETAAACTRNIRVVNRSAEKEGAFANSSFGDGAWSNFLAINQVFFDTQCAVNASQITGLTAKEKLTALDWENGWELYNNIPFPQAAAELLRANEWEPDPEEDPFEGNVRFFGRTYLDNDVRYMNWTASGFTFSFKGTGATAAFVSEQKPEENRSYLKVFVDGVPAKKVVLNSAEQTVVLAQELDAEATHTVTVYMISDNAKSAMVGLRAVTLTDGTFAEPAPESEKKIEIIGDSISVGYGNLGTSADPWKTSLQDGTLTYAALAAQAFGADYNVVALSGRGIKMNYGGGTSGTVPSVYDYTDAIHHGAEAWNFDSWQPDVIVINLGTNDASNASLSAEEFSAACKAFLQNVRAKNPNAYIIYAYGFMNTRFATEIQAVIEDLKNAGDNSIMFLPLATVTNAEKASASHPTLAAHANRAEVLIDAISTAMNWETERSVSDIVNAQKNLPLDTGSTTEPPKEDDPTDIPPVFDPSLVITGGKDEQKEPPTAEPETDAGTGTDRAEPPAKGCASAVSGMLFLVVAILSAGLSVFRRSKQRRRT